MPDAENSNLQALTNELIRAATGLAAWNMAILGEGNLSGKLDQNRFLIKASGTSMGNLKPEHLVLVDQEPFLELIDSTRQVSDGDMNQLLLDARCDKKALKPSVETVFHAWLLTLPGVAMVGHCHATAVNKIMCSPHKYDFAYKRLFPDQIVYCGAQSVLVPYVDPGLVLAREIARLVTRYMEDTNRPPKTILLENHGLITLGSNRQEITGSALMAEKSAEVFTGAASLGEPVFMSETEVERIDGRMDEAYRQKIARSQL